MKQSIGSCIPCSPGERLIVGTRQIRKKLQCGCVLRIYFADNADPALLEPLKELSRQLNIQPISVRTMAQLGRMCDIDVGAAAAAVVR